MRYRPSISYYTWDETSYSFELVEFLNYDKYISQTVALKMAHQEVAFVAGLLQDYAWFDRVI